MRAALLRRLKEPSTYAGLGVLGSIFGLKELTALTTPEVIGAVGAILAMLLPEHKPGV